ncbi:malate dehydrogenase, mitochondrial-like [Nymphaea colorata]|nr:malate dehydrogenase, mitochondrial-like [Nymphaea colorata]
MFSSTSGPDRKVVVLGSAGGIVQPLALLMKLNPLDSSLALYDIAETPGMTADVSHINSRAQVAGYMGEDQLGQALEGSDVVIIPASVPRKPGMTRDDLFNINTDIIKSFVKMMTSTAVGRRSRRCGRDPDEGSNGPGRAWAHALGPMGRPGLVPTRAH